MRLADGLACVVTGGGSGIGRCVCQEFVRRGATVVVADIDSKGFVRACGEDFLFLVVVERRLLL